MRGKDCGRRGCLETKNKKKEIMNNVVTGKPPTELLWVGDELNLNNVPIMPLCATTWIEGSLNNDRRTKTKNAILTLYQLQLHFLNFLFFLFFERNVKY